MNLSMPPLKWVHHIASGTVMADKGKDEDNAEEEGEDAKYTVILSPQKIPFNKILRVYSKIAYLMYNTARIDNSQRSKKNANHKRCNC